MPAYYVRSENAFEADSPSDAVLQMVAWLQSYAPTAGYRVWTAADYEGPHPTDGEFIDAESIPDTEE